ncbi:MAG: hypothetical protein ACK2U1_22020 [Anaerolineales bacterium]
MLRNLIVILMLVVLLMGCAAERNEIMEEQGPSESAPVTSSEIAVPSSENVGKVEVVGGNEGDLREFIQRWFTPMVENPSYPSEEQQTTIVIGELPEDMPFEFPLPEEAVVFASIQSPYDLQIMLDVPMDSADLMGTYTQNLEEANWNQVPESSQGGGFVSAAENWQIFCDEPSQNALTLQYFAKSDQESEIRITLYDKDVEYMCDPQSMGGQDPSSLMLPVLDVPAGALVTGGGSSSGGGSAESSSDIRTDLSPKELNAHFSRQMEDAGWNSLDSGDEGSFSWGSWEMKDEQDDSWNGILIILKDPVDADRLFALMRVVKGLK